MCFVYFDIVLDDAFFVCSVGVIVLDGLLYCLRC